MKDLQPRFILALFALLLLLSRQTHAQMVTAISPSSSVPGQKIDVIIRGANTSFRAGATQISFAGGNGIVVTNVVVQDAQTVIATLQIDAAATMSDYDVIAITGNENIRLDNGFQLFKPGGEFRVNIQALPVNNIDLSTLDINNSATAPVVFFCNLFNDNVGRKVRVYVFLYAASRGLLGQFKTDLISMTPLQYKKLVNGDFTTFKSSGQASSDFIKAVKDKGGLPPDEYTYRVEVRGPNGTSVLATDETVNVVSNPNNNPELIAPGAAFDEELNKIFVPQPFFQWFGNSAQYDFALYEIKDGQNEQEAARGLPVYKQENITAKQFLYPAYAEKLKLGSLYAWQVKGKYAGAKGTQYLPSQVFRFMYGNAAENAGGVTISKIIITPQEIELMPGQAFHFNVQMLDSDDRPITNLQPTWKLSAPKASITNDGTLTAGNQAADFALIVKAGTKSDFATVKIKSVNTQPVGEDWLIDKMIRKMFGLK